MTTCGSRGTAHYSYGLKREGYHDRLEDEYEEDERQQRLYRRAMALEVPRQDAWH